MNGLQRAMIKDLHQLPADLPVPLDDGACDHLPGLRLPRMSLPSTQGGTVDPGSARGTQVLYCFPMLGRPDGPPLVGWNEIPGARGCTPQTCAFRDQHAELRALSANVFGVSAQPFAEQCAAHKRLDLPFALLNDTDLLWAQALRLPTFEYAGQRLIKRLTLIVEEGVICKVFYPVFPPDGNASQVLAWLQSTTR